MKLLFKKLRWKNMLSTGNIFTEIDFLAAKTTLIVGKNGAGKSTILDALSLVLFNKPFREVNKGQLVNTITQKNLVVEVEFSIGNNEYKVVRGIKPNVFEIYHNDKLVNQEADSRDYQQVLEKQILRVNHKAFCQIVVLGSATFQPFMQLKTQQRREIIEDILDLQIFSVMNQILKGKAKLNESELTAVNNQRRSVGEKISLINKFNESAKADVDNSVAVKNEEKERIKKDVLAELATVNSLKEQVAAAQQDVADKKAIRAKIDKLTKLKHKIEHKLEGLNDEVSFFRDHDDCPTCKQSIDQQFKCSTVESKSKEIEEMSSGLAMLEQEYQTASKELKAIEKKEQALNKLNIDLSVAKTKFAQLKNDVIRIDQEIEQLLSRQENTNDTQLEQFLQEEQQLNSRYNELDQKRATLNTAGSLLKDDGIKSQIIKQYVPVINKHIAKSLQAMNFFVQFELDENFDETIKSRYRDVFTYESFSEGEKQRINLAILFTWRTVAKLRNSVNTNLLIMDEIFDSSLDSDVTEDFMNILKNNLTSDTNTFIISHKTDQIFDKFDRVIHFEKVKNFSKVINQ